MSPLKYAEAVNNQCNSVYSGTVQAILPQARDSGTGIAPGNATCASD